MQQNGIPYTQNNLFDPFGGLNRFIQALESRHPFSGSSAFQDTEISTPASAGEIAEPGGVPPTQMPEGMATTAVIEGETQIPFTPLPGEIATPIPLLPWVQTLSTMCTPVEGIRLEELSSFVSSPYKPPPPGSDARHMGVDFVYFHHNGEGTIDGKAVYAILPGKVVSVINNRLPYGYLVIIETRYSDVSRALADALNITEERSLYHLYAHLKYAPPVVLGQRVPCGFQIGNVGNSGTQVPHLHLETRWGPIGGWFPSMGYMEDGINEEEKNNYLYWRISGVYQHFDPLDLVGAYIDFIQQPK